MRALVELMTQYREDDRIEGMLLQRISFFGDYDTVLDVHPFRNDLACRVVKPHRFVLSRGDAAGFTVHPKYKERGHRIAWSIPGSTCSTIATCGRPRRQRRSRPRRTELWTDEAQPADYYQKIPREFLARFRGDHPAPIASALRPTTSRSIGVTEMADDADAEGAAATLALEADRPVRLCRRLGPLQPQDHAPAYRASPASDRDIGGGVSSAADRLAAKADPRVAKSKRSGTRPSPLQNRPKMEPGAYFGASTITT